MEGSEMSDVPSLVDDPSYEKIREKHKKNQEKRAAARMERIAVHNEAVEKGVKKLVAERTPTGLYYARWEGGGELPPSLKGMFTDVARLRALAEIKYGAGILK
jgi:hypothetical protein